MVIKKREIVLKCVAAMLAFVIFGILVAGAKEYDKGKDTTYKIVCLGDSNLGNVQDRTGVVSLLEKRIGQPVLNGAFGGSTMTSIYGDKTDYSPALSMFQIATSICNKNFGVQKSAIDTLSRTNDLDYFKSSMDKLSDVDFKEVEILIIEHGINDYFYGITVENARDLYDVNTFSGALRNVLTMLKREYPDMRIILVTPSYCAPVSEDEGYRHCDIYNYGGGYLEDYVNVELEIAKEFGVEVIDLYHEKDINEGNFNEYLYDGLHYNDYGREVVADIIADYLLGETK